MPKELVIVFDTSNEKVVIGVGEVDIELAEANLIDEVSLDSKRASNQKLLPEIDNIFKKNSLNKTDIKFVGVGKGPGSFTGVRIALATAKGICSALNVPLLGISTLDAIAENARLQGFTGDLLVVADAMRGEIYPVSYNVGDSAIERKNADKVVKPDAFLEEMSEAKKVFVAGDGLVKFRDKFEDRFIILDESYWHPTGKSLLTLMAANIAHVQDASSVLPVYTRLSDAEENELAKIKQNATRDLVTGVQGDGPLISPCELADCEHISELESENFQSDAWNAESLETDIKNDARLWLKASVNGELVGYVGASYSGDAADILKICVSHAHRRKGIAGALLNHAFEQLRNLGVNKVLLEVRASNSSAISFYQKVGFQKVCERKNFYGTEDGISYSIDITSFLVGEAFENIYGSHELAEANSPVIFAIESSCDETAGAIVDGKDNVVSSVVSSSAKFHARFGGVVPEIASRKHIEVISQVASETLRQAGLSSYDDIDAIAVTSNPGLVGSLVVGVAFAKGVAWAADKPLIFVDHLVGHLFANKLGSSEIQLPAVASLISGGNTMLVSVNDWGDYAVLGGTIDDAVGEAFDKIARAMNLPYPGGPQISALAADGDPNVVELPRPLLHSHDLRMSLSGLKTAVILEIERLKSENGGALTRQNMADICASFEQSICDVQVAKAADALKQTGAKTFCFGGGVAANTRLRAAYETMCERLAVEFRVAPKDVCGDNAAMIGLAAQFEFASNNFTDLDGDVSSSSKINSRG